ncbi:MAG: tetraacyldisaccharide 4'-kinase [Bacteroidales bacterium]|nr:tetraacyldisaccharide 4'-kinase [Bacteroidales bacterium]
MFRERSPASDRNSKPKTLQEYLQKFFGELDELAFPDHYSFIADDLETIASAYNSLKAPLKYIITTEKDAMRIREFTDIEEPVKSALFYVPIGVTFLNDDKDEFDNLIVDYVRKNKENIRFS